MPVNKGTDKQGNFFRWGKTGKKYYFNDTPLSIRRAYRKAKRQGVAIILSK